MKIVYRIVEHDGGWAYKLGSVFSETFPTHKAALAAARRVAREQQVSGEASTIEYETADGKWHEEHASGHDRPEVDVVDAQHPKTDQ